jgi:hypothetical protein
MSKLLRVGRVHTVIPYDFGVVSRICAVNRFDAFPNPEFAVIIPTSTFCRVRVGRIDRRKLFPTYAG